MKAMTQVMRASAALQAAGDGRLDGTLIPAVFGCPYGHTLGIVTAPLPLGRCRHCETPFDILDARQIERTLKAA